MNYHTVQNLGGEVRGQIAISPGKCGCTAFASHSQFVKCVKKEIKKLDKSERKEAVIKALTKAAAKSACEKSKGPKNTVACCLPTNAEANIVTDKLCVAAKGQQVSRRRPGEARRD